MTITSFAAFAGLCLVLAVTPGPDTFLTLRFSMARRAAGMASSAGSSVGTLAWSALVAVGLATLLEQSADVYRVVKIVGGLYLVYLGVSTFLKARKARAHASDVTLHDAARPVRNITATRAFLSGMMSTLLNPKVGLFFLAIVPQFVPSHQQTLWWTLLLGATTALVGGLYLVVVASIAAKAMAWLKRPRVTSWLERISSGILAVLGIGTVALSLSE